MNVGLIIGDGVSSIITDGRILRAMSKGRFRYPVTKGHPYVDGENNPRRFDYKGCRYEIRYFSGCFFPFVVKI
uniref:Uncharacterized protein n=1 Tax=viral metagenome TaxID=1070528 RepID=A0A6M3L8M1_9ZZZZ